MCSRIYSESRMDAELGSHRKAVTADMVVMVVTPVVAMTTVVVAVMVTLMA